MIAPATQMTRAARRATRVALAMLPVGAAAFVAAALGGVAAAALAMAAAFGAVAHPGWTIVWSLAALAVAWRNLLAGIAVMSAFDWRPLPGIVASGVAIVAAWPGWWLD